ncbi:MAG: AMP-binding protein [Deltaproteobacteria bacterium]|nr:AMP-binding protein [Deltaproteobacteria bacterium]
MGANLSAILREQGRRYGDRRAVEKRVDGVRQGISWRKYDESARAVGLGLYRLGVGKGDGVSLPAQNRREWIESDLPAHEAGYSICNSESKIYISKDKTTLQKILDVPVKVSTFNILVSQDNESGEKSDYHAGWKNIEPQNMESLLSRARYSDCVWLQVTRRVSYGTEYYRRRSV